MTVSTMRPILATDFIKPDASPDIGPAPMQQWIEIGMLVVDPAYQREIRGEGRRNVRKIASEFRWSSFAPVIVSPIAGGKFAIVDGQHRTTAAALIGITSVPCHVIVATASEQAAAFRAINGTVTKMSRQQLHVAALAAGEERAVAIEDVCRRAGVEILRYPVQAELQKPGQTMAVGCIDDCLRVYGRDILVTALQCVTETANRENTGLLTSQIIRALCEVLKDEPTWRDAGDQLLTAFDDIDIGDEHEKARLTPKPKGVTTSAALAQRLRKALSASFAEISE